MKRCLVCNTEFVALGNEDVFCSQECQDDFDDAMAMFQADAAQYEILYAV